MNINWNIHGFPESEQKDIVKKLCTIIVMKYVT